MKYTNQKPIELSENLLNLISGGCNHKCACESLLDDIKDMSGKVHDMEKRVENHVKGFPEKVSDAEKRIKEVPNKVNKLWHEL